MELKTTLEGENEQMFKLLTDVEGNMQNIADEAISSQEAQWKTAMAEIVENSKREIQNLQDQLIRQKSSMDEIKVVIRSVCNCRNNMTSKISELHNFRRSCTRKSRK